MKYIDGTDVRIGDIFTDGTPDRLDVRLKNKAKVLYVDQYTLVWFPLNDFTTHTLTLKYVNMCQTLGAYLETLRELNPLN